MHPKSRAYDSRFEGVSCDAISQFGEVALVKRALSLIGTRNNWCFEFGAHNGTTISNTAEFRQKGWSCCLAEADEQHKPALLSLANDRVNVTMDYITAVDDWLNNTECPKDVDFGSIDVDGPEYWLFHDMTLYRPRVLCIEYSPYQNRCLHPERTDARQAGKDPLLALAKDKGYKCVAETYVNLILVDQNQLKG